MTQSTPKVEVPHEGTPEYNPEANLRNLEGMLRGIAQKVGEAASEPMRKNAVREFAETRVSGYHQLLDNLKRNIQPTLPEQKMEKRSA